MKAEFKARPLWFKAAQCAWRLVLAFVPFIGAWNACGYAGCSDVGPTGYYCSQHRLSLRSRLVFWWRQYATDRAWWRD